MKYSQKTPPISSKATVVVTGASAGVGRAIAVAFGQYGCKVALIARGEKNLIDAAAEVEAAGGEAFVLPCDVSDAAALQKAADMVERKLGPIDIWINNAMVTVYSPVSKLQADEIAQVTNVTYLGQVFGAQAALAHMRRRRHGTILFINSALGHRSIPFQAPYCAAKAATRGFVDSLRSELRWEGNKNIKLTMVYLPAVNTPQFDWARNKLGYKAAAASKIYQPEAVAKAVVEAAIKQPRELWLGFPTLKLIIWQSLAPGIVDRMLARKGPAMETTNEPEEVDRTDNLFNAGRFHAGSRGRFNEKATMDLAVFNPDKLRAGIISSGFAIAAGLIFALISRPKVKKIKL